MNNNVNVINYYNNYTIRQKSVGVNERHKSIMVKSIRLGLKKNQHVLEIGCGIGTQSGLILKHLSKKGTLTAYDISDKSIEIAQKTYSKYKNAKFVCADAVTHDFGKAQFDVIVLPDVIEHILLEQHSRLFEKLAKVLKPQGSIFIHIPNPAYLAWCHKNRPDLLQIIDQPIYTNVLIDNILPHGLVISNLETYSIWVKDGDYQFIVMRKQGFEDFSQHIEEKITIWNKISYKLKHLGKK